MKHTQGEKIKIAKYGDELHLETEGGVWMGEVFAISDADRIHALWNAANDMPTEEAVKYIEHGREMVSDKEWARDYLREVIKKRRGFESACICLEKALTQSLTKLEAK